MRILMTILAVVFFLLMAAVSLVRAGDPPCGENPALPALPATEADRWVGPPLSATDLEDRVVLVSVWTFG